MLVEGKELVIRDLAEPPFTFIHNQGPFGVFDEDEVVGIGQFLNAVRDDVRPKPTA